MSIQRLHVAKRYSEVVIHNGTIYLAGQLADDFDGDIREQTRQTLANLRAILNHAGADFVAVDFHGIPRKQRLQCRAETLPSSPFALASAAGGQRERKTTIKRSN